MLYRIVPDRVLRFGQVNGFLDLALGNRLERAVAVIGDVVSTRQQMQGCWLWSAALSRISPIS